MIVKILSTALLAAAVASTASVAIAQAPEGATMLVPGVYTTPEITAKCQQYAAKRVGMTPNTDNVRQSVALACAKKLWDRQLKSTQVKGTRNWSR
jgi:hypothetical protein